MAALESQFRRFVESASVIASQGPSGSATLAGAPSDHQKQIPAGARSGNRQRPRGRRLLPSEANGGASPCTGSRARTGPLSYENATASPSLGSPGASSPSIAKPFIDRASWKNFSAKKSVLDGPYSVDAPSYPCTPYSSRVARYWKYAFASPTTRACAGRPSWVATALRTRALIIAPAWTVGSPGTSESQVSSTRSSANGACVGKLVRASPTSRRCRKPSIFLFGA